MKGIIMISFSKRSHKVENFNEAKQFLLDNNTLEEDIEIKTNHIAFNVKDATLKIEMGETIFFEGVFDDGTTDIWVVDTRD
jgi:hypothetical protein